MPQPRTFFEVITGHTSTTFVSPKFNLRKDSQSHHNRHRHAEKYDA